MSDVFVETPDQKKSRLIAALIDKLEPKAGKIRALYENCVDPKPCVGWLPMLFELIRRANDPKARYREVISHCLKTEGLLR